MRPQLICLGMFALLCAVPAAAQTPSQTPKPPAAKSDHSADDQAVAKLLEDTQTALNNHDAKAMAETWATDGDLRAPTGELVKGRAKIEKYWTDRFAGMFKNLKVTVHAGDTRYLGANVAIGNGSADVSGATSPDGKELPPYTVLVTNVLVKRNGSWQVLTNRVWPANAMPGPAPARRPTT